MTEVTFKAPPNHRKSKSCGTCRGWSWGYEGEGHCETFPSRLIHGNVTYEIYEGEYSTMVCDDWVDHE